LTIIIALVIVVISLVYQAIIDRADYLHWKNEIDKMIRDKNYTPKPRKKRGEK
jgi:hypothetical protein